MAAACPKFRGPERATRLKHNYSRLTRCDKIYGLFAHFANNDALPIRHMDRTTMLGKLNRVFTRILILAVLALGALAAFGIFVISESRTNLYEQKKADTRHVVESVA